MVALQARSFPQLDGLRTLAVFLVFVHHWNLHDSGLGIIGVQLFFVISGFLITGILLSVRDSIEEQRSTVSFSLRQFYARRFLRIFPLYYACLILFVVLDRFEIRETAPWYFLYASNIRFFLLGTFEGSLSHFWTLAVEEQFYLVWPFLVLLIPRKWIKPLLWGLIFTAPATRILIWWFVSDQFASTHTLLPANFDTLGLGALGAVWRTEGVQEMFARRLRFWLVPICLAEIACARCFGQTALFFTMVDSTAVAIVSLWLVLGASAGFGGVAGRLLSNRPVRYLGQLSYGLYVWHMFAPAFLRNALGVAKLPASWNEGITGFLLLLGITVATATASWFLLEEPCNRLKRFFSYPAAPSPQPGPAGITP